MPKSRSLSLLVFGVAFALGVASCSQDAQEAESGSLSLQLAIAPDVRIDEVSWEITGGDMDPMSGSIDTSAPGATASIEVFGLPPSVGKDYTITMEANATDGETACKGSEDFGIDVGEVTEIEVMLNCKRPQRFGSVRVNGEFNICAELVKMVVSPLRTSVGNDIDLFSAAEDAEGDSIDYSWTGTGGSFDDPHAASATYTCDDVGDHFVRVTVTDEPDSEYCMSDWTVAVTCVEPPECPSKGDLTTAAEIFPQLLPDADTLWEWQTFMVGLGLRLPANEPLAKWHDFLAAELESLGLDVVREPVSVGEWYDHRAWSLTLIDNGTETNVPLASYYPYSGQTPEGGVVGELADAGLGLEADFDEGDFAGKVALVEQPRVAVPIQALANPSYVYDPDNNVDLTEPYDRASIAFLARQVESPALALEAGAVGAIIALDYSPENAAGQFTPFQDPPQGIPTVYVDQATGAMLRERVAQGATVRLELLVDVHESGTTHDIIATLPGRSSDELIIVNTHTDGTSSAEENGPIAVLALAQYLSSLPDVCRARTFVFVLTPGHFYYDLEDTQRFIDRHPEIIEKTVGSLTTEHLGQMEWLDDDMGYHGTGLPELSVLYGSDTPVQAIGENAVIAEDLRRTIGSRPLAGGRYSGVGRHLNLAGVPNLAYLTGPNTMLSWGERTGENAYSQHLDKTDRDRMHQEVRTFARIATSLDGTPAEVLCAGMCRDTAED